MQFPSPDTLTNLDHLIINGLVSNAYSVIHYVAGLTFCSINSEMP